VDERVPLLFVAIPVRSLASCAPVLAKFSRCNIGYGKVNWKGRYKLRKLMLLAAMLTMVLAAAAPAFAQNNQY
jgi:hypothetical protein